jgi:muramoyltetrapeptide carboxypeptidase
MTRPEYLSKGDKIAIVACARKISREDVQPAVEILQNWGLEVVFGEHTFNACDQYSGTDEQRASDLQKMLDDDSVKAVISARGGYGTIRIIDMLDFSSFKRSPKWIIGYSDITVLHSHINRLGIATLHATMPVNFLQDEQATLSLRDALFGAPLTYSSEPFRLNRAAEVSAPLVGGNLSLLYALNGSKSDLDLEGKILFIEDLDEYLYHVDRMMVCLKRAGKFDKLAGMIVGGMTEMKDNTVPFGKTAEEIIADTVKEFSFPVCYHFPAGHIVKNMALPMGQQARLIVNAQGGKLEWLS